MKLRGSSVIPAGNGKSGHAEAVPHPNVPENSAGTRRAFLMRQARSIQEAEQQAPPPPQGAGVLDSVGPVLVLVGLAVITGSVVYAGYKYVKELPAALQE